MFYGFIRFVSWPLFKILYQYRVKNKKFIPREGKTIIIANHSSYVDPVVVGLSSPRPVRFMAKSELFSIPVLKNIITWLYAFPVRREYSDRKAFRTALQELEEEEGVVCLFPEGTRIKDRMIGQIHPGAALLTLKSGALLIPMGIGGTNNIVPLGKIRPRFPKIRVIIGQPIDYSHLKGKKTKDAILELSAIMEKELKKYTKQAERWSRR